MTATQTPAPPDVPDIRVPAPADRAPAPPAAAHDEATAGVAASRILLAAFLATSAAAWMLGGVFDGLLPRLLGIAAAAIGAGWAGLLHRYRLASAVMYLLAPVAFLVGFLAALVLPNATGVTGTIPALVSRAIRSGGLLEPPVPFDPGWRFLVVVLFIIAGGAAASIATGWGNPNLVLALPVPLVIGGGFVQPPGAEVLAGSVSLVLLVAALMVIYAAQLAGESGASRGFELKQAARGAGVMAVVIVAMVALNQAGFLFPKADRSRDLKPQKPKIVSLAEVKDKVLFDVRTDQPGPWRLGVMDVYDGRGWLLPPFDADRLTDPKDGALGRPTGETVQATFTVRGLEGHTLPSLANALRVEPAGRGIAFDPRTQTLRQRLSSAGDGYRYTVTAAAPPSGAALSAAQGAVPRDLAPYVRVPAPPPGVATLLAQAPGNPWERLQFLRNALYEKVVAAGSGVPVDVPPAKVDALLAGGEGTPFEITAAEALLARWAGLPARIGYGFYRGKEVPGGYEVHPRDGANWLEVWFPGLDWVPVVGVPPKARASLSALDKNRNVSLRPSDELSLQLYIPTQIEDPILLYQVVRYWIGVALPFVVLVSLAWAFLPVAARAARRVKRRRWAYAAGIRERIAVEYAEFRDLATDLNAGDPYDTPLEYLDRVVEDDEHAELAWLVTRTLWGDLTRDLREEDADAAARLAASMRRRLARGQSPLARVLALTSRASLRRPYDAGVPNLWPAGARRLRPVRRLRLRRSGRRAEAAT